MKNMLSHNIQAYFFDFDGVVVESTDIKTDAFYELYLPYGEDVAQKARDLHSQHQGVNRYQKFQDIHRLYLGRDCDQAEQEALSHKFSAIVLQKIMTCPFVDGVLTFLQQQKDRAVPVFLFSATPHDELRHIVQERGLGSYFADVYGAPETKVQAGQRMIAAHGLDPAHIIFVGDSPSDEKSSDELGTVFVGRISGVENSVFRHPARVVNSFTELL